MTKYLNFKKALILALFLFVTACANVAPQQTITIVHTNDVHSSVAVEPYVKGYVDAQRAAGKNVVLVSAGDAFDGTPFAQLSKGMDVATVMNITGYEMFVMGNHEQFPVLSFEKIVPALEFPVLAANLDPRWKTLIPSLKDYVIKNIGGVKFAFIGISYPTGSTGDAAVAALERARDEAKKEGADVFIGLVHLGVSDPDETLRSTYLAQKAPWLAAIIDGHDHKAHEAGVVENGVLIAETGEAGNNIGVIEINMAKKTVESVSAKLIPIKGQEAKSGITPDAKVQAFIDEVNARNAVYLQEVVMNLPIPLPGLRDPNRRVESVFGDLLMDAVLWKTKADVAVFPGPGFRANLPAGDITREQLLIALNLDMEVAVAPVTGAQILEMLEVAVSAYPNENNSFVQQAGMRIEFNSSLPVGSRITKVTMADGSALDKAKTYNYATKRDSYWVLPGGEVPYLEKATIMDYTLVDLFIEYMKTGVKVTDKIDNRTKDIK